MCTASSFDMLDDRFGEDERLVLAVIAVRVQLLDLAVAARGRGTRAAGGRHELLVLSTAHHHSVRDRSSIEHATRNGSQCRHDRFAVLGWEEKHDAPTAARAAYFSAPRAGRKRGVDRGFDLRRRNAIDQRFAAFPLFRENASGFLEVSRLERLLHVDGVLRDLVESALHFLLAVDLPLVHLPVVRSREMLDAAVVQQHV